MEKYLLAARINYIYNVKQLIFGAGSVNKVGEEAKRLVGKKASAFLVTDKGVEKAGLADEVKAPLEKEGLKVEVFVGVAGEPTFESMERAADAIRKAKYDVVIGVGGGSVMDTAKTAAALATNPRDVSYYYSMLEDRIKQKPLPHAPAGTIVKCKNKAPNTNDIQSILRTHLIVLINSSPSMFDNDHYWLSQLI